MIFILSLNLCKVLLSLSKARREMQERRQTFAQRSNVQQETGSPSSELLQSSAPPPPPEGANHPHLKQFLFTFIPQPFKSLTKNPKELFGQTNIWQAEHEQDCILM